jgi:hypothetical protein
MEKQSRPRVEVNWVTAGLIVVAVAGLVAVDRGNVRCSAPRATGPAPVSTGAGAISMAKGQPRALGTFVASAPLLLTDPMYGVDSDLNVTVAAVAEGRWVAAAIVGRFEGNYTRTVALLAHREGSPPLEGRWVSGPGIIGVDSGQAGIFSGATFHADSEVPKEFDQATATVKDGDRWYSSVCEITLREPGAGVLPHGVVASSGFGDGGYRYYLQRDERGTATAIQIVFIEGDE